MALRSYLAGEVAQDFSDGFLTRREALRRLVLLGLSVTAGGTLLAACGGDDDAPASSWGGSTSAPAATATTTGGGQDTPDGEMIRFAGPNGELQAAWAPCDDAKGAVLVIHENRGLTPHFYDLVG